MALMASLELLGTHKYRISAAVRSTLRAHGQVPEVRGADLHKGVRLAGAGFGCEGITRGCWDLLVAESMI
ncbi:hypothetical protein UVI_02032310 [Ustilaginoidea virens]|uniref:Uncharacterized protein n=1 Tax=Ustilaginoidea virens TaxID=1159556 RepID=A0A1B5KVE9_USTVR|nr:hypothetical protein UVI_02032310 [Ustilaginoidea virens]